MRGHVEGGFGNMKGRDDIFFSEGRLCIELMRGDSALKGYEFPKNKQSAILYHSAQLTEINWQGIQMIGERCCIVFYPNERITELPIPSFELSGALRTRSLTLLRNLSHAVEEAKDTLFWNLDSIPLSNFWFFENGDILLLSRQMGDIVDRFELDEDRFTDKDIWLSHNSVEGFGKAKFLFQLLYYSLTGKAPFSSPAVRENGFKAIPLRLYFPQSSSSVIPLCNTVDKALSDDRKFQLGIRKPMAFFRQTLDSFEKLPFSDLDTGENPVLPDYEAKVEKKARTKAFFRTKGFKTLMAVLAAAAVIGTASFYIYQAVKPPLTRELNETQIIEYYYEALNNLDVSAMNEPLKNGYSGPDFIQVSTLYVTGTMRKAYEGSARIIKPSEWLADGQRSLPENAIVYGTTDLSVEKLSNDVYRATVLFWTSEGAVNSANNLVSVDVSAVRTVYDFTFRTRGKGENAWREVINISMVSEEPVTTIHTDYV